MALKTVDSKGAMEDGQNSAFVTSQLHLSIEICPFFATLTLDDRPGESGNKILLLMTVGSVLPRLFK